MRVEIWSDIVCPWCYIGRRRFELALHQFPHRDQVEVVWRSFQLDPDAPREYPGSVNEMLMEYKGISRLQAESMHAQVTAQAAQVGLEYRFDIARPANTFDAHRLIHFALAHGRQGEMKERLQQAYFTEGLSIGDTKTLVRLAEEVGLDGDAAQQALDSDAYNAAVQADIQQARRLGIHGVPFFVLGGMYGVSGAQPSELFSRALEQVWG